MRGNPKVFLFYGNQNLLIDEQVLELISKILPCDTRDLGFQRFSVEEILKGYFFLHIIGMAKFVSYQEALSNFQSQDEF